MEKFLQVDAISTQQHSQAAQSSKSSSASEEHRHYLKLFIQTYRNLPTLWDTSLRDYTSRDKRAEAYQQLMPIYRNLKRDATLEDVKKKINTLRTNYRKELKAVEAARKQGNQYHSSGWTFDELNFLQNVEKIRRANKSVIKCEPSQASVHNGFSESDDAGNYLHNDYLMNNKGNTSPMSITDILHKSFVNQTNNANQQLRLEEMSNRNTPPLGLTGDIQPNIGVSANATQCSTVTTHANKLHKPTTPTTQNTASFSNGMVNMACEYLSSTYPEEESIARTWTQKLKRLPREQRIIAEKFINDILFEAESGNLHRGSMQLNALEPYIRFEEVQNDDDETTREATESK